jgi:hypothetical protein
VLIMERLQHVNRIKGLPFSQGASGYEPLPRDRRARLDGLQTGDGRRLPLHLKAQVCRELDRLGGFAHQMLSSMMYALMGDVFEKPEVATATGVAGMFGYLGGALFTLMVGALATSIGYEPLFALLFLFDLVAALTLWAFIGVRQGQVAEQPAG